MRNRSAKIFLCVFLSLIPAFPNVGSAVAEDNVTPSNQYDSATGRGRVPCVTNNTNTGFFFIENYSVVSRFNCVGSVVIPQGVTSVAGQAFDAHSDYQGLGANGFGNYENRSTVVTAITSLTIPNSVTSIGDYAFRNLSVTTLEIPNSVISIGQFAFSGATQLTQLTIGTGLTQINPYVFSRATSLTSLTIPGSVTSIEPRAFEELNVLTSLTIQNGVRSIGSYSFTGLTALTSLTIPNSVTSVGNEAFSYLRNLTTLNLGTGLTTIGDYAFIGALKLLALEIPNSVTSIGLGAFAMDDPSNPALLSSISIGKNVVSIGAEAFRGAPAVTELDIPGSVTSIGNSAFQGFSGLETITIASSVISLGAGSITGVSSGARLNYCGDLLQADFTTAGIGDLYPSGFCSVSAPSAPASITASLIETGTVTVSFSAPSSNGGAPISYYQVTSNPGSITRKVNQESGGSTTLTGLSAGTTYTFTVVASNWGKSSLPSIASNAVTTPNVPGAPTGVVATRTGRTTANVSFTAPSSNSGDTITAYVATSSPGGITGTVTQSGSGTIAIPDLSPGTDYTFTVVARNGVGDSISSSPSNSAAAPVAPGAPTGVVATRTGVSTANVSFTAPSSNGGDTITAYVVTSIPDAITRTISQAGSGTVAFTGLNPGVDYTFIVVATNGVGNSVDSSESNSITTPTAPGTPTALVATRTGATTATLSFTAPVSNGGEAITSYVADSSPQAFTETISQTGSGTISITGLDAATSYSFSMKATNAVGDSDWSEPSNSIIGSPYNSSTGDGEVACVNDGQQRGAGFFRMDDYVVVESDGCRGSAVIPSGVLEINEYVFDENDITAVTIPNTVHTIGESAFENTNIRSLVIPNSVTFLGVSAFEDLEYLTSLVIGNSVETITARAFSNASTLTSLILPESVRAIDELAFNSATLLTSITIPVGVTRIGDSAFGNLESLATLTILNPDITIDVDAFYGSGDLETISFCGPTLNRNFLGISNSVVISCPQPAAITIGTTDFPPGVATNLNVGVTDFDEDLSYQVTVKFVNAVTNVEVSNGTLRATKGATSLIAGYNSYSAPKLGFKGTYAQVVAALTSLTWTPATGSGNISIRIGMSQVPNANEFYDANSGHYYRFVPAGASWVNARTAAEATMLYGLRGYLAEINSEAENSFIGVETTATNVWMGASDRTTEGSWIWDGATSTYVKPTGSGTNAGRTASYHSWANGEPNDFGRREDCAVTNWQGVRGKWNDLPCGNSYKYLIEFGGRPNETSTAIGATLTTTVTATPPPQYTVTYDADGGSSTPTSPSRVSGERFAVAGAITKTSGGASYLFAGWNSGTTIYKAGDMATVANANITLTAEWVLQSQVAYLPNGGTFAAGDGTSESECNLVSGKRICTIDQVITLNSPPTKDEATFSGWEDSNGNLVEDTNLGSAGIQTTVTNSRYIFSARWTSITYTVTYVSSGSTAPMQNPLSLGETFTVAAGVTKVGFEFSGWSDGTFLYQPDSAYTMGTSAITLTAQWTAVYTVTYSPGTGSGTSSSEPIAYYEDTDIVISDDDGISRSGSTFSGWSDGTSTYQPGDVFTIGTVDVTLTAVWSGNSSSPTRTQSSQSILVQEQMAERETLQIKVARNQSTYLRLFTSVSSTSSLVSDSKSGALINAITEKISSSQSANLKLSASSITLSSEVLEEFKSRVSIKATASGISVTPVGGFTGILVVPVAATINGVETVVLNKVIVNPAPPVAQKFAPTAINQSAIAWAPSTSQVVNYQVKVNGKTICQTTGSTCPVEALIGPKSRVTITAQGNDQTTSAPVVIPYVATKPIPALKVNFAVGSSILSEDQKKELRSTARVIDSQGFTRLVVSGFTDSNGSEDLNQRLSAARAKSVAAFMRTLLPKVAIKASAFGTSRPVSSNASKSGQAQNRRTEIATW